MDRLEELRTAIADNTVPGGSAFGRAAAEVIALTVGAGSGSVDLPALRELTGWLVATKPSMTSVRTVAALALDAAEAGGAAEVTAAMEQFIRASEAAIASVARHAALIPAGSRVLFHSFSGSLIEVLGRAVRETPDLTLLFTESRPYRESRRVVAALADQPVVFEGYSDAAVAVAAASADLAIVGVDALYRDGSFANKTGTLPLALACDYAGIPLHAVTEVSKLYPGDPSDVDMEQRPASEMEDGWPLAVSKRVTMRNQFFEVTPARLVTSYWTDRGVLLPGELEALAASGSAAA
jgi:translation initiation factor 2B subunit (eIF-2B alpha/beta/delta family)